MNTPSHTSEAAAAWTRLAGPPLSGALTPASATDTCPCRPALDRLGDRWTAEIIGILEEGPLCFGEMQRRIGGVSRKVLTQTLRSLERDGMLRRDVLPDALIRVRYTLTELGLSLAEPLAAIRDWSQQHLSEVERARAAYDRRQDHPTVTELRQHRAFPAHPANEANPSVRRRSR